MDSTKNRKKVKEKKLRFSSKARVLEQVAKRIRIGKVLPIFRFKTQMFKSDQKKIINQIQQAFSEQLLIVRSSVKNEDGLHTSFAGKYKSVLNVNRNYADLRKAIQTVVHSYGKNSRKNEAFVQPMLTNIAVSGVAFTADADTFSPYYIINYDESGMADNVTSGKGHSLKTYVHYKGANIPPGNAYLNLIIKACKKLEALFVYQFLDIEFAIDTKGTLYLFQVRPLAARPKEKLLDADLQKPLESVFKKIKKVSAPHPDLLGTKTIFGIMPDWNPAEIIGHKPKTLSISLYKEIVTDAIWAYQRDNYGYRALRSHPLMISLLGVPYIDVRVDFNSFVPKDLDEKTADKLVRHYISKLTDMPHLHDKIEFEIVHSCYYFTLHRKLKELRSNGFTTGEINKIEDSLVRLTNNVINPKNGLYKRDLKKIEHLKYRYSLVNDSELSLIDKIYWLTEDCKRYGTLPFAGVARAAFIGIQVLKSFVDLEIITVAEYNSFVNSLNTITKNIGRDLAKLSRGKISKDTFLNRYGHLRPGTYDILSLRYDENFDNYFSMKNSIVYSKKDFSFNKKQLHKIDALLKTNKINVTTNELLRFIKEAIEGREYGKYVFTKSLSRVLQLLVKLGAQCGISREDMAFVDVKTILQFYSSLDPRNVGELLRLEIKKNKAAYAYTKAVKLPSLIINPKDVYSFYLSYDEPNFITQKQVSSEIIKEELFASDRFEGKIAFIKSADPGYDFLFTKKIGGLITQFGGANSHMAIRCAELGIPAVIGCGERNFSKWVRANYLEVDCSNKQVRVIS